jgi:threonine dehydrogenase-like Zn-dependent dehydrogenase
MLCVHLEKGKVTVINRRMPIRRRGHALIRLLCAGICNTDLELQRGYYNFRGTPGHEFVGEVLESDNRSLAGRRVVGEINLACGDCDYCRMEIHRHCPNRSVLGIDGYSGAFSEYFTLPDINLHVVPKSIPYESATFVEPLAAACEILVQVRIPAGSVVAVLGDRKLGLLIAQVLKAHNLEVHLYGKHREKLAVAEARGIQTRRVAKQAPRAAYRWIVEATGSSKGLPTAVTMTMPRDTVLLKSTVHDSSFIDTAQVVVNEINLIGSRCGPFPPALSLLRSGKIDIESMISDRFPLSRAPQAFQKASRKESLKVLLVPD